MAQERESALVRTDEAMKIAGFHNRTTFLKCVRARRIQAVKGRGNRKLYSRAKMLELARDREAAEKRRVMFRNGRLDPLNEPATTGELHAQAFELFEKRTSLHDVVKTLKLPAPVVSDLFQQWWKLGQVTEAWLHPKTASEPAAQPAAPVEASAPLEPPVRVAAPPTPSRSETDALLAKARETCETARKVTGT